MAQIFQPNSAGSASAGSGSKNYLSTYNSNPGNGDFELGNTNGFALGNVTLTSSLPTGVPTFGSGSSGNLSLSTISSSQLAGTYSMGYVSSAATTAGDFVASSAFTIDLEDQAKVMTFKFYYTPHTNPTNSNWSGTSSNSFGVAIYDVTGSAWIVPAGVWSMTQSGGVGYATGTFQTTASGTQYRIVVYNANATSGATTLYFDDFFVGPQTAPLGPAVTDFGNIPWTPTGSWSTNSTYTGSYRRFGDSAEFCVHIALAGAPTSASLTITVPTGLVIDTTKLQALHAGIAPAVGYGSGLSAGGAKTFSVQYNSTTTVAVNYDSSITATLTAVDATHPATFANADYVDVYFSVPIVGWSSNVSMSSDTDTRVIEGRVNRTATQTGVNPNNSAVKLTWDTVVTDNTGSFNSSNNQWVAPVSGYYVITGAILLSGTNVLGNTYRLDCYVNNALDNALSQMAATAGAGFGLNGASPPILLKAGDVVDLRLFGTGDNSASTLTVGGSATRHVFGMHRISGPAVIAATETVGMRYTETAGATMASVATAMVFGTKTFDTHNAFGSTLYTVPITGIYEVYFKFVTGGISIGTAGSVGAQIAQNGTATSLFSIPGTGVAATNYYIQVGDLLNCVSGDTISALALCSIGTSAHFSVTTGHNVFNISRAK